MNEKTAGQFGKLSAMITMSLIKAEIISERPTATGFDRELVDMLKEAKAEKDKLFTMVCMETHKGIKM
jgi:hypothetical protein